MESSLSALFILGRTSSIVTRRKIHIFSHTGRRVPSARVSNNSWHIRTAGTMFSG
jgi:hypothetical protein